MKCFNFAFIFCLCILCRKTVWIHLSWDPAIVFLWLPFLLWNRIKTILKWTSLFNGRSHKVHVTETFLLSESYYIVQFHYKCQRFSPQENQLALNKMKSRVRMWKMSSKHLLKERNYTCWENIIFKDMSKIILHSNNNIKNKNMRIGNSGSILICFYLIYTF